MSVVFPTAGVSNQARGTVAAVSTSAENGASKIPAQTIFLEPGLGVRGDVHAGVTVQHAYTKRHNPDLKNLRQVHIIAAELLAELAAAGFPVRAGSLGENITSHGLTLTTLPLGTRLRVGANAVVEITGLRNPCAFLDRVAPGVRAATSQPYAGKTALRNAVMGIVIAAGAVSAGDAIVVELPAEPHRALPILK